MTPKGVLVVFMLCLLHMTRQTEKNFHRGETCDSRSCGAAQFHILKKIFRITKALNE